MSVEVGQNAPGGQTTSSTGGISSVSVPGQYNPLLQHGMQSIANGRIGRPASDRLGLISGSNSYPTPPKTTRRGVDPGSHAAWLRAIPGSRTTTEPKTNIQAALLSAKCIRTRCLTYFYPVDVDLQLRIF